MQEKSIWVRTQGAHPEESRYIGIAKTALQQLGWLDERPRAKTRISPFAKLTPKAP